MSDIARRARSSTEVGDADEWQRIARLHTPVSNDAAPAWYREPSGRRTDGIRSGIHPHTP
jgi:hypothetical protein